MILSECFHNPPHKSCKNRLIFSHPLVTEVGTNGTYVIDGKFKDTKIGRKRTSGNYEASKMNEEWPRELFADFSKKFHQNISGILKNYLNRFFGKMNRTIRDKVESILNEKFICEDN